MPSTYSPNLRIELIANGEQSGTWGTTTNTNLGTLIEDAIAGYVSVSIISANQALTALDGAADQSRNMVVNLTTTTSANFNVYIPPADKFYVIRNASAYDATIYCSTVLGNTTAAGTGVTIPAGRETIIFSDGTNVASAIDYAPSLNLGTPLSAGNGGTGLTVLGTGVATAFGNAVNTTGGLVTQSGTLAASELLLGGGSGTAVSSTTTGAGVVTALGNSANGAGGFTTVNGTATLTNKRIDPRTSTATSTASLTPDISSFDQYNLTAQAVTLGVNAPTGSPVDGNRLILRILDNGVAQTINWNGTYTAIGVTLPTTTTASKMTYVGCIYNSTNTRWDVVAVTTQA